MSFSIYSIPSFASKVCRMSSALSAKRVVAANLNCDLSGRFICSLSQVEQLRSHAENLAGSVSPGLVSLATFFSASGETHNSCRGGTGVFLGPNLIVTSAHVVGHASTSYETRTVEKPGRFEKGSIIHTSCIGSTAALTSYGKELNTRPLAVNFTNDIAVLELVDSEGASFPDCALASSVPARENILMAVAHERDFQFAIILGNVRAVGVKTIEAKAPWPREDELGWIEHDWFFYGGNGPPPGSVVCTSGEKVTGTVTRIPGGPWFNLWGEVVGISSWEFRDDLAKFSVGFAVPSPCIRSVLEYAKTKRADDPIVMDCWVDGHIVTGD